MTPTLQRWNNISTFLVFAFATNSALVAGSFAVVADSNRRGPPQFCRWPTMGNANQVVMLRRNHRFTQPSIHTISALKADSGDDDSNPLSEKQPNPPKTLRVGSLEALAIATSIFFIGIVYFLGDSLFATPSGTIQAVIDADEVLKSDFVRIDSSVPFY
jgi:hypothetical protein